MLLNGGEFLLDLTALSLVASASSVTISNENVLSQLTDLKSYIKNQKAIKPVWIKFFDDDSDEIVVARGEIRKLLDDLEFDIFISSKGKTLTIHIEFTQKLDDNSNPIDDYYIDSGDASYVYTSAQPIFEEIVDKDGHARFIEGDVNIEEITGVTKTYGKWSLSGSHLMFVLAGNVANGTVLPSSVVSWAIITDIPKWIRDKIYPIFSTNVDFKSSIAWDSNWQQQTLLFILQKSGNNIVISQYNGLTLGSDKSFRIQFDLIIDNE